jgi:hypothetical protein
MSGAYTLTALQPSRPKILLNSQKYSLNGRPACCKCFCCGISALNSQSLDSNQPSLLILPAPVHTHHPILGPRASQSNSINHDGPSHTRLPCGIHYMLILPLRIPLHGIQDLNFRIRRIRMIDHLRKCLCFPTKSVLDHKFSARSSKIKADKPSSGNLFPGNFKLTATNGSSASLT